MKRHDKKGPKPMEDMPTIPISRLRRVVEKTSVLPPERRISLEFVLTALFPTVWNNIKKYASDCYTQGYLQGKEDALNENKRNNRRGFH